MTVDATPSAHPPKTKNTGEDHNISNQKPLTIKKIQTLRSFSCENNDVTIHLDISVSNRMVKLLIDTGAHTSMLRSKCIRSTTLYYPQIKYCIVGINGPEKSIKTHGAIFSNIDFNGIKCKHQFQIAGDDIHLNYDGILGLDFLTTYGAILDLGTLKMTLSLPPWHNMYEINERDEFEKQNPHIQKIQIENKLIYVESQPIISSNTPIQCFNAPKNENKKQANMLTRINRLAAVNPIKQYANSSIKILPNSVRNFRIDAKIPLLCKSKNYTDGVYTIDTIVDAKRNVISIMNETDEMFDLTNFDVETEPIL